MELRTTLAALMLAVGTIVGTSAGAQQGTLDTTTIAQMDLDTTVYTTALARNTLGIMMQEYYKRHPEPGSTDLVAVSPTADEAAQVASLSEAELTRRIEGLSTALTALADHGRSLQQQGKPLSDAMKDLASKLGANTPLTTAAIRATRAEPGASVPSAPNRAGQAGGATGEALCVAGQQVEFVHLNRRWPGTAKGRSYGGDQCLVTSNMNTGSFMQDLQIDFADLRPYAGAPEKGVPDVPGSRSPTLRAPLASPAAATSRQGGRVLTTPEEVLKLMTRDHEAAVARYDGQAVRVTSLPGRIGISGNTMRLYADPSRYSASVVCLFEPDRMGELRGVPDGAAVTVEGDANIAGAERINIQNCHVVEVGAKPQQASAPARPPMGRYVCMQSGQGIGDLTLAGGTYTASAKSGSYAFDAATGRFRFTSGNYADWGWSGVWKTDAQSPGGVPEPRIDITDGGKLNIHCYPPK